MSTLLLNILPMGSPMKFNLIRDVHSTLSTPRTAIKREDVGTLS